MQINHPKQDSPIFIHRFPFRFVQPYSYTYKTFTKGRWIGKELLNTLVKQFKAYPPQYYENAIKTGKIMVKGQHVEPNYILKNGDQITHISLRVEPPVLDLPIQIVHQSQDFLVINKPPSMIVHTGGGFHFNTIQNLLKYEYGYENIHVLHRLDKCTSGLLIFSKNKNHVATFHEQSQKQTMKKMYYARVGGNFIWQEKWLSAFIQCVSHKDGIYRVTQQIQGQKQKQQKPKPQKPQILEIKMVENPLEKTQGQSQQKIIEIIPKNQKKKEIKKQDNNKEIKDSRTLFKKLWYDEKTDSSLLECYPITGRTHQIRVHLQYLGFPILNDIVYGGKFVGNKIINFINNHQDSENSQPKKKVKLSQQLSQQEWDFKTKPWEIMLHSYKYKFGGRQFTTQRPYWFDKQTLFEDLYK